MWSVAWKRLKIIHFAEEDTRLLSLPVSNKSTYGGYIWKPTRHFPICPPQAKWIYIIDLDNDILRVFLADFASRMLDLRNLPRWLFECAAPSSHGPCRIDDGKHVFMDPLPRAHLPPSNVSAQPDRTALDYYHRCTPKLRPVHKFPGLEMFDVRMHFRLALLTIFYNGLLEMFHAIKHQRSPRVTDNFHTLAYSIINLARSSVEVRLLYNKGYSTATESTRGRRVDPRDPYAPLPSASECWIEDVLVVLDQDISTKENLHAAIGRAIQRTRAGANSSAEHTTPTDQTRPTAIICSLTALVLVYIRGGEVSHTPNLEFFPQYSTHDADSVASDGVFALFDIFYRPSQLAEPRAFPRRYKHLPTEICQLIFAHACPSTRNALESSCRLFHGISHDHGLRVADCYLQKRSYEGGTTSFVGESYVIPGKVWGKAGATYPGGRARYDPQAGKYTSRTIVHLVPGQSRFGPVYRTFLMMPDSSIVKLQMPLLEAKELGT